MIRAACTIVSLNYLPYARTLCESFLRFHPDCKFYVLLVDRLPEGFDVSHESFELVPVEDLGIPNFEAVAFKYGILELNTNVKPTFLKRILDRGVDQLIYFDPDISICSALEPVYEALNELAIVLTPHSIAPNPEDLYAEELLLVAGVFNLGFIGVARKAEALRFLEWWEQRCLSLGYNERWSGLFVDQKWIDLVPCYFDSFKVLKHPGCNVAYWNLHERRLEKTDGGWMVNGTSPLIFFHFSGVSVDGGSRISKHTDRFDLGSRPDLVQVFADYREALVRHGIREASAHPYAFGSFNNGSRITKLQRAVFAANLEVFGGANPFDAEGSFYRWSKERNLHSRTTSETEYGRKAYSKKDPRIKFVNATMRLGLRALGSERYAVLMKYLEYASVLRNQKDIFGDAHGE